MAIKASKVTRVIIAGDWFTVDLGTFKVVEYGFVDDRGEPIHEPLDQAAYEFWTIDRDFYTGPLSSIELVKLVND